MIAGYVFYRRSPATQSVIPDAPAAYGWVEIEACADTTSLDGSRTLELLRDGRAISSGSVDTDTAKGNWTFDGAEKLYRVTFPGVSAAYARIMAEGISCMLIAGDPAAADLRASWFASTASTTRDTIDDYDQREPDR